MRILLTILSIAFLFSSCKKEDEKPAFTHGKLHSNLYPFLFDTGSYWVYKDTVTNMEDSMIVQSITKEIYNYPHGGPGEGSPGDEEYFEIIYKTFPSEYLSYDELARVAIGTTRPHDYGPTKYVSGKEVGLTYGGATVEAVIDSMSVEGQMYHEVIRVKCLLHASSVLDYHKFFYVDHIGVIKREDYLDTTLVGTRNLLRYNAVMKPYF